MLRLCRAPRLTAVYLPALFCSPAAVFLSIGLYHMAKGIGKLPEDWKTRKYWGS